MARNKYPEETVKRILDTSARLFAEKGYDKTTLQDIINVTKLSKGAIYHHFSSKEEIFIKICTRIGDENSAILSEIRDDSRLNGIEKLKKIFRTSLLHTNQETMLCMVPYLLDSPKFLVMNIREIYEEVVPYFIQPILEEGIADGSIRIEHTREVAEVLMMMADVWLHPLLKPTTPKEMRARCEVYNQMTRAFIGFELLDEDMITAMITYSQILQDQREKIKNTE
ncbi:TetR/AcrR family transcriptional regulator [Ruminococcus sp. OA3]|uniref:TetR/AcrR family transcriptional regulator n=1 Tax=Ruminococcus sp. OA3 TaxID=2914164 RepID=UPI001F05A9C5|nr:TetR/AcrR family transcriptional regulator [Ruminococcus sp. OA3]MCH1981746.1 TetR/AcrR family transcriptional regulator [Ruminococcus sp. OA3]